MVAQLASTLAGNQNELGACELVGRVVVGWDTLNGGDEEEREMRLRRQGTRWDRKRHKIGTLNAL